MADSSSFDIQMFDEEFKLHWGRDCNWRCKEHRTIPSDVTDKQLFHKDFGDHWGKDCQWSCGPHRNMLFTRYCEEKFGKGTPPDDIEDQEVWDPTLGRTHFGRLCNWSCPSHKSLIATIREKRQADQQKKRGFGFW